MSSSVHFIIDNFDTAIQLDVCGNLFKSIVTMDVSAVCDLYVDASLVRQAFQFQTDASDVMSGHEEDIKYFINRDTFWTHDPEHSFAINPADAQINTNETTSLEPIMDGSSVPEKNMVCHDFVRFLSKKLFNTPYGVDLFDNEEQLLNNIRDKSRKVWSNIDKVLCKYDVVERPELSSQVAEDNSNYDAQLMNTGTYGPDGWRYYTYQQQNASNFTSTSDNVSKKLLDQIGGQNPARLKTIVNTTDIQPIPFLHGDTISLKLTISPADGQHNLTDVAQIGSRTFRIRYNLVDNHAPLHSSDIEQDINEYAASYRTFTPPLLTIPSPPPSAPSTPDHMSLQFMNLGDGVLHIEWLEVSGAPDSYQIRYTIDETSYVSSLIPSTGASAGALISYELTGLTSGVYTIEISAINTYGSSEYSEFLGVLVY
jgi:hypothetical protein